MANDYIITNHKGEKVCRDCEKCATLSIPGTDLFMILAILYKIFLSWNIGLFQKKCPDCGHSINSHSKRADGSFAD